MKKFQPIALSECKKLAEKDSYYSNRWDYYKEVIGIIKSLSFDSVLELGPYKIPVIHDSDIMDRKANVDNLTYQQDATDIPWPIKNKKYDLFIALQVWEHLKGKQKEAFKEVMRISKMAIMSFPLNWYCPGNPRHHGITEEKISEWTLGIKPVKKIIVGNWFKKLLNRNLRIIYFFKFK